MWGQKREPGDYYVVDSTKIPRLLGNCNLSVFLRYKWRKTSKLAVVYDNGRVCFVFQFFSEL